MSRWALFRDGNRDRRHALVYVAPLESGLARVVAGPAGELLNSASQMAIFNLQWSPDGRQAAFTVARAGEGHAFTDRVAYCDAIYAIDVDGAPLPVGAGNDAAARLEVRPRGAAPHRLESCGPFAWLGDGGAVR